MSVQSKKLRDAVLFLCPRDLEQLGRIIDSSVDYDCFLVNRDPVFNGCDSELIQQIASRKSDWIEVFGYNAEEIHDAIDASSVASGRQPAVGFGAPMTSWNDYESHQDVIEYIRAGGHGSSNTKVLVFIGAVDEERKFWLMLDSNGA